MKKQYSHNPKNRLFTVAKLNSIGVLLSPAANFDLPFDVKNVFLHDDLEKEIYGHTTKLHRL
jgi:hypothetical protein